MPTLVRGYCLCGAWCLNVAKGVQSDSVLLRFSEDILAGNGSVRATGKKLAAQFGKDVKARFCLAFLGFVVKGVSNGWSCCILRRHGSRDLDGWKHLAGAARWLRSSTIWKLGRP